MSRSSALASKASGYPIAKVTAKIALGYSLDEIKNEKFLECWLEGLRFLDLVRWGVAADVLNPYFAKEATRIAAYTDQGKLIAKYDAGDEFLPIPNTQLVLSKGVYVQSWPFK